VRLENDNGAELLGKLRVKLGVTGAKRKQTVRGKGMAIAVKEAHYGEAVAEVGLDDTGAVYVLTTVPDTGTGAHTIFRQIVGEALELAADEVTVVVGNTDTFANDVAVGGSRVTYLSGHAVYAGALALRKKLIDLSASHLQCPPAAIKIFRGAVSAPRRKTLTLFDLACLGRLRGVSLKAAGTFKIPPGSGGVSFYGQGAEVAVDPETGQVRILRIVSAHDVGTIINPVLHQGQIEGGMIQGLGFSLMEDLADEDGKIVPASLGDYKIPNVRDVPPLETIFVKDRRGPAPYESKAIGEHSTSPTAAAIVNAIYDATGIQIKETPVTAECIYMALRKKLNGRAG
jgi:CO/xanthine dehydrogenase Mo-binding subunit